MKTLLIISALFIINCRPIQVAVECPHQNRWGGMGELEMPQGIAWPPKEYIYIPQQEPGYLYIWDEKIPLDTIMPFEQFEGTYPADEVQLKLD